MEARLQGFARASLGFYMFYSGSIGFHRFTNGSIQIQQGIRRILFNFIGPRGNIFRHSKKSNNQHRNTLESEPGSRKF